MYGVITGSTVTARRLVLVGVEHLLVEFCGRGRAGGGKGRRGALDSADALLEERDAVVRRNGG